MAGIDLPWLAPTLSSLLARHQRDRLPHALLITGQPGLGKQRLADAFAHHLLCRTGEACGDCKDCHLLSAGSHPDLKLISPEEDSKQIKVEQVRSLIDWVNQTPQIAQLKIAVLNPAHAMNRNSANALLKAMEEPPPNTYIILVSDEPARLLPTIRSRAQSVNIPVPDADVSLGWLAEQGKSSAEASLLLSLSDGEPLTVLERFDETYLEHRKTICDTWKELIGGRQDVVSLTAGLSKLDPVDVVEIGLSIFTDVARHHLNTGKEQFTNQDLQTDIEQLSASCGSKQALWAVSRIQKDLVLLKGTQNPNKTLLLEQLMIDCRSSDSHSSSL